MTAAKGAVTMPDRAELIAIFIGGAAGALVRVWLGERFAAPPGTWPWVVFAINVSGAFLLAFVSTRLQTAPRLAPVLGPLIGVGFCGAYTTFSTLQVEALDLVRAHRVAVAGGYELASVAAGLLAVWSATRLARRVAGDTAPALPEHDPGLTVDPDPGGS
jgi:fluoride exporter